MEELLYRIAACAYEQAHASTTLTDCQQHQLTDICEGENKERTIELIALYLRELKCLDAEHLNPQQREYIIRMVIAEWLAPIEPNTALAWLERAQAVRPWPTRRIISPF